jgi:ornithine cyclodeaminase
VPHPTPAQPRWVDATAVRRALSPDRARRLLRQALVDGLDPAVDPPRQALGTDAGQLLVMPSASRTAAGVKVLSVAPGNGARGLERIQAVYVLMDGETLTPSALLDGAAITSLRTPAVSAVAVDALSAPEVESVVIFGSGPQALGHAEALLAIRRPSSVTVVGRRRDAARATAQRLSGLGTGTHLGTRALTADDHEVEQAVREAQVVVTATSSATPVLEDAWVTDGTCVVAIGSHEAHRRELPGRLLGRSLVVVEDVATARREAGDVILAAAQGHLAWGDVRDLRDVVLGRVERVTDRPTVFKSVGMAWQDLVVAEHAARSRD